MSDTDRPASNVSEGLPEPLSDRTYRIVERTAHMGLCSQTHHEHLARDAARVQESLDAARSATPSSEEGLRELRALSEAATPGPWGAYISYSGESGTPDEAGLFVNDKAHDVDGEKQTIISDFSLYASEHLPDLEFIVAAVNYVRAALASTERAATPDDAGRSPIDVERLIANKTVEVAGHLVVHVAACPCPEQQAEVARLSESTGSEEGA